MYNDIEMPMHEGRELPQFTLRQIDLPEILKWEVNGKYYVLMNIEMIALRNRKDLDSKEEKTKMEADFQVLSIKPVGDKPEMVDKNSLEKKDFEDMVYNVKSGNI